MIKVVNIRHYLKAPHIEYIGRAVRNHAGSPLANPYKIGEHGTRDECIAQYDLWIHRKLEAKDTSVVRELIRLQMQHDKEGSLILGCWCAPMPCHGDILRNLLLKRLF